MQCRAVQCSAAQCSAVQYSAVQCCAVLCSAMQGIYNSIGWFHCGGESYPQPSHSQHAVAAVVTGESVLFLTIYLAAFNRSIREGFNKKNTFRDIQSTLHCWVYTEYKCWDPKDGELCLARLKSGETLMEDRSDSDVQIDRRSWV